MENILSEQGFEPEMIGGGSFLLSRYLSGGGFVMVSGNDGTIKKRFKASDGLFYTR